MEQQLLTIMTPPSVELENLKNLFIQLSSKTCNLKCKHCYIEKDAFSKPKDDFISLEKVKKALSSIKNENLNSIYLTGGEPLMHPDFNQILRMCLKISNTTVMSNGIMINDKKVRFLKKLDDESNFETIYRISLDSTNEIENDNLRGRGSFRKAICAIMSLIKYEFNPIICMVNYKNQNKEEIFENYYNFFKKKGIELDKINLKIIPFFDKKTINGQENFEIEDLNNIDINNLDCHSSRIISQTGIYSCPMLVNDYRSRVGSSLDDYSKTTFLDCQMCSICTKTRQKVQVNDWM